MDNRVEVHELLTSRRAKITPRQAAFPDVGTRCVPGPRRGEVAALAGVSTDTCVAILRTEACRDLSDRF